jgi:hypothetical protein
MENLLLNPIRANPEPRVATHIPPFGAENVDTMTRANELTELGQGPALRRH